MKNFIKEFKEFAVKGNVLDLAVGVIIGAAFGKIVSSLVNDLIMPTISLILGGFNFQDLVLTIGNAQIKYGSFIQSVVDFLVVSFCIFLFIKSLNRMKRKQEIRTEAKKETAAEVSLEVKLLTEIRDLLKAAPSKH